MTEWLAAGGAVLAGTAAAGYAGLRRKGLHRWLIPYLRSRHLRRHRQFGEETHLILAICDHYEPKRGGVSMTKAHARVQQWLDLYPKLFDAFRDSDGRPPQHTFFYPQDEYEPELVEMVASLCRRGYGEVEVHLHHDGDTAEGLRHKLLDFKRTLRDSHGLLGNDRKTGETVYGFIHGNWALDNSRHDGRWCGVNNELDVLLETGCYADFTMPSAPSETQTSTINQLYWAVDDPNRPKSHDRGFQLGFKPRPERGLLMIQGPLSLDWKDRKYSVLPRIENGNLQNSQPPSPLRLQNWMKSRVSACNKESWVFVKLYTHGVHEPNPDVLLGPAMVDFHLEIQRLCREDTAFHIHYVTAREMANAALAAADNFQGMFDLIRDYRYHLPTRS